MSGFKINFKLQSLDKIQPFGEEPELSLSWFGLTDGLLWLDVGGRTVYEYDKAALKSVGVGEGAAYNDYYIARFIEDFFYTFGAVSESVPEELYDNAERFARDMERWEDSRYDDDDESFKRFYLGEFSELYEWYSERSFDSGHLVDGPFIGCFRCGDRLKIVWHSGISTDNGKSLWTAPDGSYETGYADFVKAVKEFFAEFCTAMDEQVERALLKEWGAVALDKRALKKENSDRRAELSQKTELLDGTDKTTDWSKVLSLYARMREQTAKAT